MKKWEGTDLNLNIGCGLRKLNGFVNIDRRKSVNPDCLMDVEKVKLSTIFAPNSVKKVNMSHFFEHLNNPKAFMEELYKICQQGAFIEIRAPYWTHRSAIEDPDHKLLITENSFMYYSKDTVGSDGSPIEIDCLLTQHSYVFRYVPTEIYQKKEISEIVMLWEIRK